MIDALHLANKCVCSIHVIKQVIAVVDGQCARAEHHKTILIRVPQNGVIQVIR